MRRPLLVIAALLLASAGEAKAKDGACLNAALIVDFEGGAESYRLTRGSAFMPVGILRPLRDGDRVRVLTPGGELILQMADRSLRRLRQADGEQCVSQTRPSWLGNMATRLGEALTVSRLGRWYGVGRGSNGTGQALSLAHPDLRDGTARVSAGERHVGLAWNGGEPPFSVDIVGPGNRVIVRERVYENALLLGAPRSIAPGRYLVSVRDSRGAFVRGAFLAGRFRPPAREAASSAEALVTAAELYEAGPDRSLDAFLVLSPHYEKETTVGWMMAFLTEPPTPPAE